MMRMGKLLLILYVLFVLALSGTLKADPGSARPPISEAKVNLSSGLLTVTGQLSGPCWELPKINVASFDEEKATLELVVVSEFRNVACSEVGPALDYASELDLNVIQLTAGKTYLITFMNPSSKKIQIFYTPDEKTPNVGSLTH